MKLLLDQGLPRAAARLLREAGEDAVHTGDCGLATASDAEILTAARLQDRTVVTLDSDFQAILALSGATGPSVIRIRIEGLHAEELARLMQTVIEPCRNAITKGSMISVTKDRVRIHRLPIGGGTT